MILHPVGVMGGAYEVTAWLAVSVFLPELQTNALALESIT